MTAEANGPDQKLKEIFADALERENAVERNEYLAEACGGDATLRAQVEALLKAHAQAGEFLEQTVMGEPGEPLAEGPGTVIGHYKLLEKIGEGGFGSVYVAEQEEPVRRRVALKIIKLGMDTRQVVARFEAERQALAMMDHPNIAKVPTAGDTLVADGTITITKYTGPGGDVIVPDSIDGLPVTRIGDEAFSWCSGLTSVTIPNSVTTIGDYGFFYCTSLTSVYFQGNAPIAGFPMFDQAPLDKVYYLPGTLGWGETFAGLPTAVWFVPNPSILTRSPGPGVGDNQFGFTISWATNAAVTVEASADLANPVWTPVTTHTLTGGTADFTDPDWAAYPRRFYRLRQAPPQ